MQQSAELQLLVMGVPDVEVSASPVNDRASSAETIVVAAASRAHCAPGPPSAGPPLPAQAAGAPLERQALRRGQRACL
eukprot:428284-Pyramimonas_sp.AAC.1